jgi:hypothetical protein
MPKKKRNKKSRKNKLLVSFTDKPITAMGGLITVARWFERIGIREDIASCFEQLKPGSNRGYHPEVVILSFMVSLLMGAWRMVHTVILRYDRPVKEMFDLKEVPSASTFSRFFSRFTWKRVEEIFSDLNRRILEKARNIFPKEGITLDLDSSVFERYGNQEGAEVGYNPKKPGRPSHHPLFAVAAEAKWILNLWLRRGRAAASTRVVDFLSDVLSKKPFWLKIKDIRADAGYFSGPFFDFLESKKVNLPYIVVVKFNSVLKTKVAGINNWKQIAKGIEVAETTYKALDWKKERRLITVRQRLEERPNAQGKLFFDPAYRYRAFITNRKEAPEEIFHHYNKRAEVENRIKEWKYDFFMDDFCLKKFFATEAAIWVIAILFNLMSWYRASILQDVPRISTMRLRQFLCGGVLGREGKNLCLRLSPRDTVWQKWLINILDKVDNFSFSNAMHLNAPP